MTGLQRQTDPGAVIAQPLQRHATRFELVLPPCIDLPVEEVLAEPKSTRQLEDHLDVRAGLADRRHQRRAQLHQ